MGNRIAFLLALALIVCKPSARAQENLSGFLPLNHPAIPAPVRAAADSVFHIYMMYDAREPLPDLTKATPYLRQIWQKEQVGCLAGQPCLVRSRFNAGSAYLSEANVLTTAYHVTASLDETAVVYVFDHEQRLVYGGPALMIARTLGASWSSILFDVVWPQAAGPILNACALAAVWAVGDFALSGILLDDGEATLPLLMQNYLNNYRFDQAAFLLAPLLGAALCVYLFFRGAQHYVAG